MGGLPSSIIHIAIHRLPSKGICHSHSGQTVHYLPQLIFYRQHIFSQQNNKISISIYYSLNFTGVDPEAEIVYFTDDNFCLHL